MVLLNVYTYKRNYVAQDDEVGTGATPSPGGSDPDFQVIINSLLHF